MSTSTPKNDLFDYDAGLEDLLREPTDPNTNNDGNLNTARPNQNPSGSAGGTGGGGGGGDLGLDEEVKVSRKRAPVAKLDENKLLSQNGIPKLRKTAKSKSKLNLKGKGHEFSDAARLLTFYQLWLDDLYPRAKFADALSIVEKLGHSKRMQVMRREWIDEGKPGAKRRDEDDMDVERRQDGDDGGDDSGQRRAEGYGDGDGDGSAGVEPSLFGDGQRITSGGIDGDGGGDDDDLFVFDPHAAIPSHSGPAPDNVPAEEDALDALLDETEASRPPETRADDPGDTFDTFDDDWEAMNAYDI